MKCASILPMLALAAIGPSDAAGQERPAQAPANAAQAASAPASPAQAAIDRAAAANKYALVFFWKETDQQTDKMWGGLQAAAAKFAAAADVVPVRVADAAEKQVVDRYGASRAPMPLVLAIAPCGAITKAFTGTLDENQLRAAFVSPCTQRCLKALQERKLVLVCVVEQADPQTPVAVPRGAQDFKADPRYGAATEIVLLNAGDRGEATFLGELQVDSRAAKPVTVFLAPPGSVIGRFTAAATKEHLVASLASAQSNPCASGKCGPNGCGPKK